MQCFKRTLTTLLPCLLLTTSNTYATNSFQSEFSGSYSEEENSNSSAERTTLTASFYLSPVNTEDKPLAAAAFLDKTSSIDVRFTRQKNNVSPPSSVDGIEVKGSSISVTYITENSGYIFSGGYHIDDFSLNNSQTSADFETTILGLGKYIDEWSSLEFDYLNSEAKNIVSTSNVAFTNTKAYILSYTTIRPLSSNRYYGIGLRANLQRSNDDNKNRELSITGAYYIDRLTSFTANASSNSGDIISREGNTFGFGAQHFFTPQITLGAGISKFIAENSLTKDSDTYSIFITSRF